MKLKHIILCSLLIARSSQLLAQDPWQITAKSPNPNNYFGETVANGMIGIVSSPEPLKVKDVVLNGAFDTYGRGRVSNIMKVFEFANIELDVDGMRVDKNNIQNFVQTLDMKTLRSLLPSMWAISYR